MITTGKSYGDLLTSNEVAGIQASTTPITAENPIVTVADIPAVPSYPADSLTSNEVAGIQASTTPITAENPAVSVADTLTLTNGVFETANSIKIGDVNDSITIAKTGLTYVKSTPTWRNIFIPMKPGTIGWVTVDTTNTYYLYLNTSNATLANGNNAYFTMLPDDYITNSQILIYIKWGFPTSDVVAGKSTTWTLAYNTLASGRVIGKLTALQSVVVNSPHTAGQEIVTLLGSPTLTASAGDMLNMVAHFAVSDNSWYRYFYGLLVQYQSNK